MNLHDEFERIKQQHTRAVKCFLAQDALRPSVVRVFAKGTKRLLLPLLLDMDVEAIARMAGEGEFTEWFEERLDSLAAEIRRSNPESESPRVYPGYKWGHAAKILNVYVRNVVSFSRLFDEQTVKRVSFWLYCPIDSYVIARLRALGCKPPFAQIKDIADADTFYGVQELLKQAAQRCGVPAVWFDDNWGFEP